MSLLSTIIPTAYAVESTTTAAAQQGNPMSSFAFLGLLIVVFYFLLWRPQSKRAKQHRDLIANLKEGDEVITSGGILGRVTKLDDTFVAVELATNVVVRLQKNAISGVVPKGTLEAM